MPLRLPQHTPPAVEPINMEEAFDLLKGDSFSLNEAEVRNAIAGARAAAEAETWRSLVLQGFDLYLDRWPREREIELNRPPLRKVEFVRYTNIKGEKAEFTDYSVDLASLYGRVVLDAGASWPSVDLHPNNPIHIRYWAGFVVPISVDRENDSFVALNHPFVEGDMVRLSVSGGRLPVGLIAGKSYFVREVSPASFRLAESIAGDAIHIDGVGSGTMFAGEIPAAIANGMTIMVAGLYETATDPQQVNSVMYERAASHWFSMESARRM